MSNGKKNHKSARLHKIIMSRVKCRASLGVHSADSTTHFCFNICMQIHQKTFERKHLHFDKYRLEHKNQTDNATLCISASQQYSFRPRCHFLAHEHPVISENRLLKKYLLECCFKKSRSSNPVWLIVRTTLNKASLAFQTVAQQYIIQTSCGRHLVCYPFSSYLTDGGQKKSQKSKVSTQIDG